MTGEVVARLPGRVQRLDPSRRVATVALRRVGRGRSYSGAYSGASGQLAPVTAGGLRPGRRIGRLVKVDPTPSGAELELIVGDSDVWLALADGSASVTAQVAFEASTTGEPTGGRPVRVEIV